MKKIVLNQKSYLLYDEIVEFKKGFEKIKAKDYEFILFPSVQYLSLFKDSKYSVGTQNFFSYQTGSFTGEINLESLKDMGINYVLLGHFERKKIMDEKSEITKEKLFKSLNSKCNTILCVGETSKVSRSFPTIKKQLSYYLKSIESVSLKYLTIAYTPSYAMSNADKSTKDIIKVIERIKKYFKSKYKLEIEVLYGGNIENSNIKEVFDICDGLIIERQSTDLKMLKELLSEL